MGIILNKKPEVADPVTTLFPSQKNIIKSTFDLIRNDPLATGEALFLLYFKKFPQYQMLFHDFKNIDYEWLKGNAKLQAHALTVFSAITNLIDNLDNPSILLNLLSKLATNHDRNEVTVKAVWDLKDTAMELLQSALGKKFTSEASEAWSKILTVAFGVIAKGLSRKE